MAGSFGFEHDKYEVSAAIGELELLPAVRHAPADWLIIADGFSCREQIAQGTGRHALHLAEVLQMALQPSALDRDDPYPESRLIREREPKSELHEASRPSASEPCAGSLLLWAHPKPVDAVSPSRAACIGSRATPANDRLRACQPDLSG